MHSEKKIEINIQKNGMEAWLIVNHGQDDQVTRQEIEDALSSAKICVGIQAERIDKVLNSEETYQEVLIAKGQAPVPGKDGYFEYLFDQSVDSKPRILEDGSVDYRAMTRVVTVSEGDVIIIYHPAFYGVDGIDVCGKVVRTAFGKDLPAVKGKGFTISEDKTQYVATLTGKIEYQGDRLVITNVLEIKENIDYLQGDIHFKGDLMIYGNVDAGKVIEAEGSIIIRGHVEGATIIAGKDIVFESGMQGSGRGTVICKGNVSGKFFEQVEMKAEGNITANSIMNSIIESGGMVTVTGKQGIILGGNISAVQGITTGIIGNFNEIKTHVSAGVPDSMILQIKNIDEKLAQVRQRMSQIEAAMEMIAEREEIGKKNKFATQKIQLMRAKISTDTLLKELNEEKQFVVEKIQQSRKAMIRAEKAVFPQTTVCVNGVYMTIEAKIGPVVFKRNCNMIETQYL